MKYFIKIVCLIGLALIGAVLSTQAAENRTATVGQPITLSAVADGTAPLTYQWKKNGVDIIGATSATYLIAIVNNTDAGTYTVNVTNAITTTLSDAGTLAVTATTITITTLSVQTLHIVP